MRLTSWRPAWLLLMLLSVSRHALAQDYRNPVIGGMNPDPSIVRVGSEYFLATVLSSTSRPVPSITAST